MVANTVSREDMRTVTVHTFRMGDVEDPDIYAAQPLYDWQHSPQGQWIMAHAAEVPTWLRQPGDHYGYQYVIRATLRGTALTEWLLRYGHDQP